MYEIIQVYQFLWDSCCRLITCVEYDRMCWMGKYIAFTPDLVLTNKFSRAALRCSYGKRYAWAAGSLKRVAACVRLVLYDTLESLNL